ncbi:DUF7317 family protein [Natronomonas sp. EA1]|uniref:DUF7317 family protein n=1 Tax=Natronomonas sp. EA1 TaxID=3421655 RepID=UPI003EC12594
MHQHALETALTLYESGTYTLETAARQAGVEPTRLRDCLARRGLGVDEETQLVTKPKVAAD